MFLLFSFLECTDTSHNDLELESEWEPVPRAFMIKRLANISGWTIRYQKSSVTGLLINSLAYDTFLGSSKNYALQIQRKNQVLIVNHILKSLLPSLQATVRPCRTSFSFIGHLQFITNMSAYWFIVHSIHISNITWIYANSIFCP